MSDREPGSGVAVWVALRRAHQGRATLAGHWLDSGRPVPGYVAEALEELLRGGLLTVGESDPQSCGVRRITITDAGSAHYVALWQTHNPHGRVAMSVPRRWAHSPNDQRSHLLAARDPGQIGILIGVCGQIMLWSVPTSTQPTGPRCPTCQAIARLAGPPTARSERPQPGGRNTTSP
ncbi:MAG: hypothetical protein ACRDTX_06970 [Pseudonocardiaceae bacterium]